MRITRRVSRNQRRKDGGPVYGRCMGEPTSQDGAPPLPQPENNGPSGVGQSRMVCHCDDATHCGLGDLLFRGQSGGGEGAHHIQRPELDQCTVPEPRRSIHSREGLRLSHRCCVRRHPASPAGTAKRGHSGHNGDLAAQPDGACVKCCGKCLQVV